MYHKYNFKFVWSFKIKHTHIKSKSERKIFKIYSGYLMGNSFMSDIYFSYGSYFLNFPEKIITIIKNACVFVYILM